MLPTKYRIAINCYSTNSFVVKFMDTCMIVLITRNILTPANKNISCLTLKQSSHSSVLSLQSYKDILGVLVFPNLKAKTKKKSLYNVG